MSSNQHQYIQRTSAKLFDDDDDDVGDVDDATFLANSRNGGGGQYGVPHSSSSSSDLDQLRAQKASIEQRTLDSSKRSLGLLHETEQVGTATAEELAKQREQLENTNRQLDAINTTLRSSQKHINGLKSVFGGLKNYLTGQRNGGGAAAGAGAGAGASGSMKPIAEAAAGADNSYESHPVARLRGDGPEQKQLQHGSGGNSYAEQLDQNLDLMAGSLSRLKGLAIDLNQDIESQNDLIDNISNKVEDVDVKIQRQNRDLNKMLKK